MKFVRRTAVAVCVVLLLTATGVVLQSLWLARAPDPEPANTIIVLGGDMTGDNRLGAETRGRVLKAVEYYNKGLAPRIHFTGGIPDMGQPGAGDQMAALAVSLGVPASAITTENLSESTVQNALFSKAILGNAVDGSVILVSDGFHLGRSWVTFHWAGYSGPIELAAATAFGTQPPKRQIHDVVRETLAWWFNIARVTVYEGLETIAGPDPERVKMLR